MITDHQEELASLYSLGLLDGAEKTEFEHGLATSPELRAFTDSMVEASSVFALRTPQINPPSELKTRILAAIEPSPAKPLLPSAAESKMVKFPLAPLVPWAVAASLGLASIWFATQTFALRAQNAELAGEKQLAEVAYKMAQNQLSERSLLAEKMITDLGQKLQRTEDLARLKVTALASLAGNTTEAKVIAVWDPEQQTGLLTMEKLPAIGPNQDYQIWIVDPAYKNPVNGGVFQVAADGTIPPLTFKPDQPVAQAAAFAISVEKKGGVPKAEGPIVLLGK